MSALEMPGATEPVPVVPLFASEAVGLDAPPSVVKRFHDAIVAPWTSVGQPTKANDARAPWIWIKLQHSISLATF